MHFQFCLETGRLLKIESMRSFPIILIAFILCSLAPASAWAQELQCKPCTHAFGKVQVGDSVSYSIQLSNTGSKALRITSKSKDGSAFSFGTFPVPVRILPGASVELPIIFTPAAAGYTTGSFTLVSTAEDPKLTIDVEGTGAYPLEIAPTALNFGDVTVGSSASLQATLTASKGAITISSDQSTNSEFAILGLTLPVTIPAGQSIPVTIQFTPSASGTASGQAEFTSNAVDSPTVEKLTGTGETPASQYVSLSWDAAGDGVVGYNVYRGTAKAGPFKQINSALDPSTNYTDDTVAAGTTYFYVTTSVNAEGEQSAYSNEVEAVIPSS
jgi:hypothetical protein